MHILIVDDAAIIRNSLFKSLESHCDTVAMESNGEKALLWLENHYADICITDIRMPVMDGLELIEQINRLYPWMATIVVSSYDEFEYARQSIQLHALDYILKPINPVALLNGLEQAKKKLQTERDKQAAQMFVSHLPACKRFLDQWQERLHGAYETLPLLIVDTLELLESWTGQNVYLLRPLSYLWLKAVVEQLPNTDSQDLFDPGGVSLENVKPAMTNVRSYFRLSAVQILENGAQRLLETVLGSRDHQTTNVVTRMKQYIDSHLREKINLQELADHVYLNKNYMSTLFKQETQMTVWNYIIAERMQQARDLLLNESLKIYEIAEKVGYEDVDHFTSLFKKHYGLTPLDYKRRLKV